MAKLCKFTIIQNLIHSNYFRPLCNQVLIRQLSSFITSSSGNSFNKSLDNKFLGVNKLIIPSSRFKSKWKKRAEESDSDSDDDDNQVDDDDDELGCVKITKNLPSLRLDLVLKHGLQISRSKVEEAFYESRIRINGEKALKKSSEISVGDELDFIKSVCPDNPNNIIISRVTLTYASEERTNKDRIVTKMKKYPELVIENYSDPWN